MEALKVGGGEPWLSESLRWGLQSLAPEVRSWSCPEFQDGSLSGTRRAWPLDSSLLGSDTEGPGLFPH